MNDETKAKLMLRENHADKYQAAHARKFMEKSFQRLRFDLLHDHADKIVEHLKHHAYAAGIDPGVCIMRDLEKGDPGFKILSPLLGGTGMLRRNSGESITVLITKALLDDLEEISLDVEMATATPEMRKLIRARAILHMSPFKHESEEPSP